jgi:hypothetical protein
MVDRGDDKAGLGQRLDRIVMADKVAASAVRDDNERQLVVLDRTILCADDRDAEPGRDLAEVDFARRLGARIPHRSFTGRAVSVGQHLDETEAGHRQSSRLSSDRLNAPIRTRAHRH